MLVTGHYHSTRSLNLTIWWEIMNIGTESNNSESLEVLVSISCCCLLERPLHSMSRFNYVISLTTDAFVALFNVSSYIVNLVWRERKVYTLPTARILRLTLYVSAVRPPNLVSILQIAGVLVEVRTSVAYLEAMALSKLNCPGMIIGQTSDGHI